VVGRKRLRVGHVQGRPQPARLQLRQHPRRCRRPGPWRR
jgi:hypothetical protein